MAKRESYEERTEKLLLPVAQKQILTNGCPKHRIYLAANFHCVCWSMICAPILYAVIIKEIINSDLPLKSSFICIRSAFV